MLDKLIYKSHIKLIVILLFCQLVLFGCAATVVVKGDFPDPLVERIPIKVAVIYSDEFLNYNYVESSKKRRSVLNSFDIALAHTQLFQKSFESVFTVVNEEDGDARFKIQPDLVEFQYTSPRETRLNHYEVWLKYRLKVTGRSGEDLADWFIKGYGKTPTALMTSASAAFSAAANVAMRDVGTQIVTRMPKQKLVKTMLDEQKELTESEILERENQ